MGKYQPYPDYRDSGAPLLGQLPSDWEAVRTKFVADLVNDKVPPEAGDRFIGLENVSSWTGRYLEPGEVAKPEGISNRYYPDCVLFGKLRPYLAKSLRVTDQGICSSEFLVLRSRKVVSRFLQYFTLTDGFVRHVDSSTYGAKMPRASWEFIGSIPTPVPSPQEQKNVVDFLDHETAKIDRLIAKQERLIELLKEKRQAVISHAVTKGLNPDAPMKDSGVEWLGEVPVHWEVSRLKFVVQESVAGPYGSSLTKSMYTNQGYRVYGQQQVIPDDFSIGDYYISDEKFAEMSRYQVYPGDVLVSVMGTIGRAAVVPDDVEPGIINPRLVRYKPLVTRILPRYMQRLILSNVCQAQLSLAAQGSTMEGLNMRVLGELPFPLPSLEEQGQILGFVAKKTRLLDRTVSSTENAVSLLKEHRIALISAAVTGKIDVRGFKSNVA